MALITGHILYLTQPLTQNPRVLITSRPYTQNTKAHLSKTPNKDKFLKPPKTEHTTENTNPKQNNNIS